MRLTAVKGKDKSFYCWTQEQLEWYTQRLLEKGEVPIIEPVVSEPVVIMAKPLEKRLTSPDVKKWDWGRYERQIEDLFAARSKTLLAKIKAKDGLC